MRPSIIPLTLDVPERSVTLFFPLTLTLSGVRVPWLTETSAGVKGGFLISLSWASVVGICF